MLPELACLMLTSFSDEEALFQSVVAGASGYVLKQIRSRDLIADSIECVMRGQLYDANISLVKQNSFKLTDSLAWM